jgi:hypothetical protein
MLALWTAVAVTATGLDLLGLTLAAIMATVLWALQKNRRSGIPGAEAGIPLPPLSTKTRGQDPDLLVRIQSRLFQKIAGPDPGPSVVFAG